MYLDKTYGIPVNKEHVLNENNQSKTDFILSSPEKITKKELGKTLLKTWEGSRQANKEHPYLKAKKIKPYGIRQHGNELIIPMYDCNNKLQNLQRIFPDGKKLFLPNRPTRGCFCILGTIELPSIINTINNIDTVNTVYIAEGYATAATIHEATKQPVAVAFSVNNLQAVAEIIKWEYPNEEIIICADNDAYGENNNIGVEQATEATIMIDAKLVIPQFKDTSTKPTDFNDLASLEGINEARRQLVNAKKIESGYSNGEDKGGGEVGTETKVRVGVEPEDATNIQLDIVNHGKTPEEIIKRLAKLNLIEYAQIRKQEADRLNIPVGFLDNAIKSAKQLASTNSDSKNELEAGIEPWDHKVDGSEIADEVRSLIEKHAVLSEHQIIILALWVFGSYCIDAFGIFPKLLITSPDKRCGKTTILSVLRSIVNRALVSSNVSPSAIFRSIELWKPTLLIDEGDTFINNDNGDLRGIINSGHTKDTAYVLRTEGDNNNRQPKQFSTWTPMALAMIKNPPDTILDRSIVIKLKRKLKSEHVTRWSFDNFSKLEYLRQKLKRWSNDNLELLKNYEPNMPSSDNDRATDNWLPLFAIASLIGTGWPTSVEEAFRDLNKIDQNDESLNTLLLSDIKQIFTENGFDKIHSSDLITKLIELEARPWGEYRRGKPITCNTLARLLSSFGIKSKQVWIGQNKHGYHISDFDDAFSRYIPSQTARTLESTTDAAFNDFTNAIDNVGLAFQKPL